MIKICDVHNIYETRLLAESGVDFLGYHLITKNDKKRIKQIKQSLAELRNFYPKTSSVLVTKEENIKKITETINDCEFDYIQIHKEVPSAKLKIIKSKFDGSLKIIKVITPHQSNISINYLIADIILLDSSYRGGTGKRSKFKDVAEAVKNLRSKSNIPILLAGGISKDNISEYKSLNITGFDVQSSVKSVDPNENISYASVMDLVQEADDKKRDIKKPNKVGFVISNIQGNNSEYLDSCFKSGIDFLHIDISDGFIGQKTKIKEIKKLVRTIQQKNNKISIQFHWMMRSIPKIPNLFMDKLGINFIHINRNNVKNISSKYVKTNKIFPAFDVRDLLIEEFAWDEYIKEKVLIILQSPKHPDRLDNTKAVIDLINNYTKYKCDITLDRSIDDNVVTELGRNKNVNVVSGSYLKKNLKERYKLLKNIING